MFFYNEKVSFRVFIALMIVLNFDDSKNICIRLNKGNL